MSTCADVGSFIESKTSVVQTSNVGFTSEVSDYLVVHTGPDGSVRYTSMLVGRDAIDTHLEIQSVCCQDSKLTRIHTNRYVKTDQQICENRPADL